MRFRISKIVEILVESIHLFYYFLGRNTKKMLNIPPIYSTMFSSFVNSPLYLQIVEY